MDTYGLRLPECGCLGTSKVKNPLSYGFKRSSGTGQTGSKFSGKGKGTGKYNRSSGTAHYRSHASREGISY